MADPRKRLGANVPGDFFVDSSCINCDTCRQLAPEVFGEADGYSFVESQPSDSATSRQATQALLSCPTGSIGNTGVNRAKEVQQDFPLRIAGSVYYCGFNSPRSYGGNSFFIQDKRGNWLIDSPKYLPYLAERFRALGGIANIFLTHQDDVADAATYAREFGAKRIIHRADLSAQPEAELILDGHNDVSFGDDILVIPTPGHTAGHCVLLYKKQFLFTGDHLAWDREASELIAWPDFCWYDWNEQKKSLRKLASYDFEWILPGHGQRVHLSHSHMKVEMQRLQERLL